MSAIRARRFPPRYNVPGEDAVPLFVQADFGLDAELRPQLVEIQGFPTLYAYQPLLAESYRAAYGIDASLQTLPGGLDAHAYHELLREAIVGRHDPENVVLLEIDPAHQKTRHDFLLTEQDYGVRAVDISSVVKQGNRLFYHRDGTAHADPAHLQSRHRGRTGAPADSDGLRFSRRTRRGMGRASQLVLPPQQVFPSVPRPSGSAAHAIPRPTRRISSGPRTTC